MLSRQTKTSRRVHMGKQYTRVTAEMVRTARQYEDDPRKFTKAEIAAMSGTS